MIGKSKITLQDFKYLIVQGTLEVSYIFVQMFPNRAPASLSRLVEISMCVAGDFSSAILLGWVGSQVLLVEPLSLPSFRSFSALPLWLIPQNPRVLS